jgi:hypothetical protein
MISQTINGNSNINDVFDYIKKSGTLATGGDSVDNSLVIQKLVNAAEAANQSAAEAAGIIADQEKKNEQNKS